MTENELIEGFESCTLPNDAFHHEEHVRLAFSYLSRYPVLQALERFSTSLKRFAAAHGKPNLYNETITWAYVLIIRERMARAGIPQAWPEFKAENKDLLSRERNILEKYYRPKTLGSDLAKRTFLLPDLLSSSSNFPF